MGAYVSKQDEESEISTPQFERYANLMTLDEDPRSPSSSAEGGIPRTPIVLQNQLTDPRSPSQCVARTPVFSIPEPVSPCVRFKMENYGFQDSPLSTGVEKLTKEVVVAENIDNLSEEICGLELDCEKNNDAPSLESSPLSSKDDVSLIQNKEKKNPRRRVSSKNKNTLLKQALFKPYVDDENSDNKQTKRSSKQDSGRRPLQSKTNVTFVNENVGKSSEKSFVKPQSPSNARKMHVKRKLPLTEDPLTTDKENMAVY